MTEAATPGTLPPPDIKKDKLFIVTGGALFGIVEPVLITGPVPSWVTVFPKEAPADAGYPRERHFRIMHDVQVGTVDELVELFREQITRAYNMFALIQHDGGEQPVIPQFGEPSLRLQNEAIAKMCDSPGKAVSICIKAGPDQYAGYLAPRYEKYGEPKPRQSEFERDRLKRLVASYFNYRYPDAESDNTPPTDSPEKVQALIDALTVLKQDAEARHQGNLAKAKAEEPERPLPWGIDAAKD